MRPFESEQNAAALHGSRNINITLIPGCAQIVTRWLRQKRHFDLAAFSVGLVVFAQVPVAIIEREHPGCLSGDVVSEFLRLKNSGQTNEAIQWPVEPLLLHSRISWVHGKTPVAVE